ncbi:MAG: 4-hydroxythreonine-4-phosphate dehydrogenase PdxA [Candidatus Binatia bacterium]|nr:4-hydroxythreonine-4-phosphate dehydrogenase PdxA [Candidatus Binatia bacterium]
MAEQKLPALAITLGDPAGIGPEVALRALVAPRRLKARALLVGDVAATQACIRRLKSPLRVVPMSLEDVVREGVPSGSSVALVPPGVKSPLPPLRATQRRPGKPGRAGAKVAFEAIRTSVHLAKLGVVGALCTAPVSKEWFARAGVARTGHTEILGKECGVDDVRMMMAVDDLRVVLATIHLPLRGVARALDVDGIADTIEMTAEHLRRWWGIRRPRIAVAALNPHAGDGGIYGDEEARIIAPALRRARRRGIAATGPYPADTLFSALGPPADAIIAMYHDQGLVPIKQRDVHRAVNVTLGLPFVRTSPDHGTAYDLAGKGRADPSSMRAALELALELAPAHRR